jgi:S1-C subfamily serine protease
MKNFTLIHLMIITMVTGLVMSFVGCSHAASTDTIAEVRPKVVELHITLKDMPKALLKKSRLEKLGIVNAEGKALCSGAFVTRNGYILTAKHCTESAAAIEVVTLDGQEYRATIMAESKTQDLAVIRIDKQNTPFFDVEREETLQGQAITVYGSPLGITGTLNNGYIARKSGDLDYIDCSALPGNSGGPVFNEQGHLVGVLIAGFIVLYGTTHLNVMQSLDSVQFFALELAGQR